MYTNKVVVVKFTLYFGQQVHKLLAKRDLAPPLFACEDVTGMKMVVMRLCGGHVRPDSPSTVHKGLPKQALACMEQAKMVPGDLHKPNIFVVRKKEKTHYRF
jgi:hypothetical protein